MERAKFTIYPTVDDIIAANAKILVEIKAKRADAHKVLSRIKIEIVLESSKSVKGDVYDTAAAFLKGLVQAHPFSSGIRRTAYAVAESFIKLNGGHSKSNSAENARALQGIREGYYTDKEIRDWFVEGEIRGFKRA